MYRMSRILCRSMAGFNFIEAVEVFIVCGFYGEYVIRFYFISYIFIHRICILCSILAVVKCYCERNKNELR